MTKLGRGRIDFRLTLTGENARVIRKNVRTGVANQVVNVLAVNFLVKNIDIVTLTLLNFSDRFDKSFVLLDPLSVAIK